MDTNLTLYGGHDEKPKFVVSEEISSAAVTVSNEFQHYLQSVDLNH